MNVNSSNSLGYWNGKIPQNVCFCVIYCFGKHLTYSDKLRTTCPFYFVDFVFEVNFAFQQSTMTVFPSSAYSVYLKEFPPLLSPQFFSAFFETIDRIFCTHFVWCIFPFFPFLYSTHIICTVKSLVFSFTKKTADWHCANHARHIDILETVVWPWRKRNFINYLPPPPSLLLSQVFHLHLHVNTNGQAGWSKCVSALGSVTDSVRAVQVRKVTGCADVVLYCTDVVLHLTQPQRLRYNGGKRGTGAGRGAGVSVGNLLQAILEQSSRTRVLN